MRADDLNLEELLHVDPDGGILRFANERVLLLDAVALGLLRRELIETLGWRARARSSLGSATRTAGGPPRACAPASRGTSEDEWRQAGGRLHTLQGLVRVESPGAEARSGPKPIGDSIWHDSYEAEQHLLHLGRADEPVCWTLTGFASGYLSRAHGREIYCLEERCRGKGDAVCRLVGRSVEEWGEAITPHLPYYQKACLDAALCR